MPRTSKRDQILKVAANLFIREGYRRVSVDQIVAAVPISKPTLYAHFKDKSDLFRAVVKERGNRVVGEIQSTVRDADDVEGTLEAIGYEFVSIVLAKSSIQWFRMLMSEAAEFPEIGKMFYEAGPERMHCFLAKYLKEAHAKKKLMVSDPTLSADMFLGMLKGYVHLQQLMEIAKPLGKREIRERVRYAVKLFMAGHARA